MKIKIHDVIDCTVDPALAKIIEPCLSYKTVYYRQGMYKKIRKEYMKSTLTKGEGRYFFNTGLLPRVLNYCKERNVPVTVEGEEERIPPLAPYLDSRIFTDEVRRQIQIRQVEKALTKQRGVIVAPTGTGKTMTGLAIISSFIIHKRIKILWLCHTKDLMYQSGKVAKEKFGIDVGYVGDGQSDYSQTLTCATRQSFIKIAPDVGFEFDVVLVDEAHHLSGFDGEYAWILKSVLAPVRLGLTATMPTSQESILAIEAFLGPIIDTVSIEEGQEKKIMAEIKIKLLKIPTDHSIKDLRKYSDVYDASVTNRITQHRIIVSKTKEHISKGDSVLIIVHRITHGYNLLEECKRQGVEAYFAQGLTESSVRNQLKESLNGKHIHCVIATTIWKEGVDLPELNVIINAAGGKSEIATLQTLGRGLRKTPSKKLLILYDTFDSSHYYLVSHFGERMCLYSDNEWL